MNEDPNDYPFDVWDTRAALVINFVIAAFSPMTQWLRQQPPRALDYLAADIACLCREHHKQDPSERYMQAVERCAGSIDGNYQRALIKLTVLVAISVDYESMGVRLKLERAVKSFVIARDAITKSMKG